MIDLLRSSGHLPTIDSSTSDEYEYLVKPVIDPIISKLPSNDLLRQ